MTRSTFSSVWLFEGPYEPAFNVDRRNYEVTPDGRELVMIQAESDDPAAA